MERNENAFKQDDFFNNSNGRIKYVINRGICSKITTTLKPYWKEENNHYYFRVKGYPHIYECIRVMGALGDKPEYLALAKYEVNNPPFFLKDALNKI